MMDCKESQGITGYGFHLTCGKMGFSFLLFALITLSLPSAGSFIQTSDLIFDSSQMTPIHNNPMESFFTEVIYRPESSGDSVQGSGDGVDSGITKDLEQARSESRSEIRVAPVFTRLHLGTHDRGADKADTSVTGHRRSSEHVMSEESLSEGSHRTTEELLKQSHSGVANDDFMTGEIIPERPFKTHVFTSPTNQNPSGSGHPCLLGPCVGLTNLNGTNLLWDDMRRTLAFAWEIHVFGSASLFILIVVLAVLGMAGAVNLSYPICDALTLANSLLILSGSLRAVHLLLDPYGTRQILPHATLAALHNVPMQLLLWAQVTLALVTPTGQKLLLFPVSRQRPWVAGVLGISHCTLLLLADLYSQALFPTLPLLLQALSLCWGLPFCMELFTRSLLHATMTQRSSVPQWAPSRRIERRANRVTAVCAFLGVVCCSFQFYSLLWIYGLMGNWRRFGWGWWLSQFWARILELAWGFSLLALGSWIFWTPFRGHLRSGHGQGRIEESKGVEKTSLWYKFLASVQGGQLRKSENHWKDLMPNNWAKCNMSKSGVSNNIRCPYDDQPSAMVPERKPDPASNSSSDPPAALMWQKVGDRDCVLSIIEFDMRPPSPINLRRSIDNALHHGQLMTGGLFTAPPPSWTHTVGQYGSNGEKGTAMFPSDYVGYRWMLDTESIPASLDHFQETEPQQPLSATSVRSDGVESPTGGPQREEFYPGTYQHVWPDEDITDL